jgi:hypothetical protein
MYAVRRINSLRRGVILPHSILGGQDDLWESLSRRRGLERFSEVTVLDSDTSSSGYLIIWRLL